MAAAGKADGKAEVVPVGSVTISYTDAPKELLDEVIAAASRALRAQSKGETRYLHEVRRACADLHPSVRSARTS
jgi:hypothetical protein